MCEVESKYIPIRDDFFSKPLCPLKNVRLMGSRCRTCGEVYLGKAIACQQCQDTDMEDIVLGRYGTLYSYTIIRNRPPGDYKGSEPFEPFAVGLVELPEGIRILAPLTGFNFEELKIGTELELLVEEFYEDEARRRILIYRFRRRRI
jgi:uncharacterized OB-fold protein